MPGITHESFTFFAGSFTKLKFLFVFKQVLWPLRNFPSLLCTSRRIVSASQ
jgi:hypothetical protein